MARAYTEARKRANAKWNSAHSAEYSRLVVVFPRHDNSLKEKVEEAAKAEGLSMSQYVVKLLQEHFS